MTQVEYFINISYPSEDKFTPDYIKYVYAMLKLWNMNNKKAKLSKLDIFTETIKNNADKIKQLFTYDLIKIDDKSNEIFTELFNNLILVKTKSPLVTFSKTLHFFLPNIVVPIDRKYTCNFFKLYPNQIKEKEIGRASCRERV